MGHPVTRRCFSAMTCCIVLHLVALTGGLGLSPCGGQFSLRRAGEVPVACYGASFVFFMLHRVADALWRFCAQFAEGECRRRSNVPGTRLARRLQEFEAPFGLLRLFSTEDSHSEARHRCCASECCRPAF